MSNHIAKLSLVSSENKINFSKSDDTHIFHVSTLSMISVVDDNTLRFTEITGTNSFDLLVDDLIFFEIDTVETTLVGQTSSQLLAIIHASTNYI